MPQLLGEGAALAEGYKGNHFVHGAQVATKTSIGSDQLAKRSEFAAPIRPRRKTSGRAERGVAGGSDHKLPLLAWIRGLLPTLKRAQRQIAEAILKDPEQFITQPISVLAEQSGVSAGSIVLFCKSLRLKGLSDLKISLARELAEPVFPSLKKRIDQHGNEAQSILERVFTEHINSLRETLRLNSPGALKAAANALLKAKRTVLFSIGLSYPVAYSLYARLRFIGLPAFIEFDSHMQLAAAAEMRAGEAALAVSMAGSTSETVECLRLSQDRGAKTICITNSIGSALANAAHIQLYAAPGEVKYFQAPLASRVTQLALADALLVMIGLQHKRRSLAHLERAEEHLLQRRIPHLQVARRPARIGSKR